MYLLFIKQRNSELDLDSRIKGILVTSIRSIDYKNA